MIMMKDKKISKEKIGTYRWTICALLFFGTTINYIDRQVLGILAPLLQSEIKWTESEYGWIVTAFQAAYALGLVLFGWFIDKYGTKVGYSISVIAWSFVAMAHAIVKTPFGFGAARAGLGLSEAGNFPAAIKTVAE
jgi:ACS family hexuronate transporter-like MFS transporter